jgi:hypothetical protein
MYLYVYQIGAKQWWLVNLDVYAVEVVEATLKDE